MDIEAGRGVGGLDGIACLIYDKNPRRPRKTDAIVLTWINDPMRVEFPEIFITAILCPKGGRTFVSVPIRIALYIC